MALYDFYVSGKKSKVAETPGPLTWAGGAAVPRRRGGVRAGPLAGDLLTAHLSQLGKKGTREDAQSTSPAHSSSPKGLMHQPRDPQKDPETGCSAWPSPEQQAKPHAARLP